MVMTNLILVAGTLLLVGGLGGLWAATQSYRRGDPWRAAALQAVASGVYGGLTLAGFVLNRTAAGAIIVWAVAIAMWTALWLGRCERRRSPL